MSIPFRMVFNWVFKGLMLTGLFLYCKKKGVAQQTPQYSINVNDGLLQASVYALHQDEKGFVWMGTGNGLNRFDGRRFRSFTYRLQDSTAKNFPGKIVHGDIIAGKEGMLFFLADGNLVQMNTITEQFRVVQRGNYQLSRNRLLGFWKTRLLLWNSGGSLNIIDTATGASKKLLQIPPGGNATLLGSSLYWIQGAHLWHLSEKEKPRVAAVLPTGIIHCVKWSERHLFLTNSKGAFLYNTTNGQLQPVGQMRTAKIGLVRSMGAKSVAVVRANCNVEIYFESGGRILTEELQRSAGVPEGCYLTAVLRDRSGAVWLAQEAGGVRVYSLTETAFQNWQPPQGFRGETLMAKSLLNTPSGLLVGTFERGVFWVDWRSRAVRKLKIPPFRRHHRINSFLVFDSKGQLWSNSGGQLLQIDTATQNAVAVGPITTDAAGLETDLFSFCEIAPGRYWLGTIEGVVELTEDTAGTFSYKRLYNTQPALSGFIYALQKSLAGEIYVGKSAGGFIRLHPAGEEGYRVADSGLEATTIRHFHFDKVHQLVWMATDAGLVAYNPKAKNYQVLDDRVGLSNKTVYAVLSANNQRFWISTNGGINRIDCQFKGAQIVRQQVAVYTAKDGLQSNEFNTGAYCNSGDSIFFFGGLEGVNSFRPAEAAANTLPPAVQLVEVLVNNKPFATDTAPCALTFLPLTYRQNNLSFQFAALDFLRPLSNEFSTFLEGHDDAWQAPRTEAEVRYHNLPAGHYTLWLRASNNDKVWSKPAKKLSFYIRPPFWETTLFKGFLWTAGALLLFLLLRAGVRQGVRKRLREWEKEQAVNEERNRIHRDMHDDLGSGLSRISLLSELAVQKEGSEKGAPVRIQQIARIARDLTEKMGTIIWMLQPKNDTLDAMAAYLQEYLNRIGEEMGIETRVRFPEVIPAIPLQNAQRRCVLLVTQEAINNALKHANASVLTLSMQLAGGFTFIFEDNGQGFDTDCIVETQKGGNGLENMRERVEQLGGFFELKGATGRGCKIVFGWK